MIGIVKKAFSPTFYKQSLNNYIQHVKKEYIYPGKPDFLFHIMAFVGFVGYCMPYLSTHSKLE